MKTLDFADVRVQLNVTFDDDRPGSGKAYPCALCGKPCPKPSVMMHFFGGGLDNVVESSADLPAEEEPGDMGCYPIGPACAKKVRKLLGDEQWARFAIPPASLAR